MATVELLRSGEYVRRYDSNADGIADLYYVSGLLVDASEDRSRVTDIVESHLTDENLLTKWGVPLSQIRPKRFSADGAYVQVIYGRIRGGGYFLPLTYSGVSVRSELHSIPVFYQELNNPEWKLKWFDIERKSALFRWNTRVQDVNLPTYRNEFRAFNGMLRSMGSMGMMRLVDGGFHRLASNEVRGELIFEQPQAVKGFPIDTIGNKVSVPALLFGEQYALNEGGPTPAVGVVTYANQFTTMPANAFSWMDFSK